MFVANKRFRKVIVLSYAYVIIQCLCLYWIYWEYYYAPKNTNLPNNDKKLLPESFHPSTTSNQVNTVEDGHGNRDQESQWKLDDSNDSLLYLKKQAPWSFPSNKQDVLESKVFNLTEIKNAAINVDLLEKRLALLPHLKVFVYELPEELSGLKFLKQTKELINKQNVYDWCLGSYYGPELHLYNYLLSSPYRTYDHINADIFYIPILGGCEFFYYGYANVEHKGDKINERVKKALQYIKQKYKRFEEKVSLAKDMTEQQASKSSTTNNENNGTAATIVKQPLPPKDHVWVLTHADMATNLKHFPDEMRIIVRIMRAINDYKDTDPKREDDIIIPGYIEEHIPSMKFLKPGIDHTLGFRKNFASFAGTCSSGPIREQFCNEFHKLLIEKPNHYIDYSHHFGYNYMNALRESTFCLVPKGWYDMTNRLTQALYAGCIPVSIGADNLRVPFTSMLNWTQAIIWINKDQIENMSEILESIPEDEIIRRQLMVYFNGYQGVAYKQKYDPLVPYMGKNAIDLFLLELVGLKMGVIDHI